MPAIQNYFLSVFCCLLAVLSTSFSYAQPSTDSIFYQQSVHTLLDRYKTEIGQDSRLYIGAEYTGAAQRAKGTPFFLSDSILPGIIHYHGEWYNSLGLQYDLLSGELLINDFTSTYTIRLPKEKVDSFSIKGHFFVYADSSASLQSGYYERLYQGRLLLLASHTKKVTYPASTEQLPYFRQDDDYFIKKDDRWYRIGDKGALISLLKDKKEAIKKFMREDRGDSKKDFGLLLARTVSYYDQIK